MKVNKAHDGTYPIGIMKMKAKANPKNKAPTVVCVG